MSWTFEERYKVLNTLGDLKKNSDKAIAEQEKIADAFTRMAAAMEKLAKEVAGLRQDLKPQDLDKPVKLPTPSQGRG